jgi:hypothetical protein
MEIIMAVITGGTVIEGAQYRASSGTNATTGATNTPIQVLQKAGVPSTDFDGVAAKGALCIDTTNANIYINAGTLGTNSWKLVTRAA